MLCHAYRISAVTYIRALNGNAPNNALEYGCLEEGTRW